MNKSGTFTHKVIGISFSIYDFSHYGQFLIERIVIIEGYLYCMGYCTSKPKRKGKFVFPKGFQKVFISVRYVAVPQTVTKKSRGSSNNIISVKHSAVMKM
jgi:hypothetical protein